jgi:hypothetical protein
VLYTVFAFGLLMFGVFSLIVARFRIIPEYRQRGAETEVQLIIRAVCGFYSSRLKRSARFRRRSRPLVSSHRLLTAPIHSGSLGIIE